MVNTSIAAPEAVFPGISSVAPRRQPVLQPEVNKPFLFFDDRFVEEQRHLTREVGRPVKRSSPVLEALMPWEGRCVTLWGTVLWDPADALFKMWYLALNPFAPKISDRTLLCYATSRDGLNWHRPELDLYPWQGYKKNNIVLRGVIDSPTVVLDPFNPRTEERFKMTLFDQEQATLVRWASGDGIAWKRLGPILLKHANPIGDRHTLMASPSLGQWVIYHKLDAQKRSVHMATSEDFNHWHSHGEMLAATRNDPPETEFYGLVGVDDGNCDAFGFLEMFHVLTRHLDTQLVYLDRMGCPHRLLPGRTFLEKGKPGTWDSQWVFPGHGAPIRVGEQMHIYYHGRSTLHWSSPPHDTGHVGAIGLATLRKHGYVSLSTQRQQAVLTTRPVRVTGHYLCLNADLAQGHARVELLDEYGRPIPGYQADACYPLTEDATYFKLNWGGESKVEALIDKTVRIRFHLENAKLYSFWFSDRMF